MLKFLCRTVFKAPFIGITPSKSVTPISLKIWSRMWELSDGLRDDKLGQAGLIGLQYRLWQIDGRMDGQ